MSLMLRLSRLMERGESQQAAGLLGALMRSGKSKAVLTLLGRCRAAQPRSAWPLVLEAAVHQAAADWAAARLSLERALALEPSAALHAELAKVLEKLGILPEAIAHAGRAVAMERSVERHVLKAELHARWRESEAAAREYTRALELEPGRFDLLFGRSKAHSTTGRLRAALADAEEAFDSQPDSQPALAWIVQLLTQSGAADRAARRAAALADPALRSFCRAYARLHARRYGAALQELAACRRLAGAGALARKASFYETVAAVCAAAPPIETADFFLIGLGVEPPYSATAECLRAAALCDVVFNNVMGDEIFELLRLFCGDCRPVAYHQNNDEDRLCRLMLAEARRGRRVGFVTRGSAVVYGPLGAELLRRCRRLGLSWRCLEAVSSCELINARFPQPAGGRRGAVVLDSKAAGRLRGDPGAPASVYLDLNVPPRAYGRLCEDLAGAFGPSAEALVFDHVIGQQPQRMRAGGLAGLRFRLSPSAIVHFRGRA